MPTPYKQRYNGISIHFFPHTSSTNDLAREDRFSHNDLIIADIQTEGRGQRGNVWKSEPAENLTFSLVTQPSFIPAGSQFTLSQAISLAVADTLSDYGIRASVKWPNDIYTGDKKVAGILIENDIMGSHISRSVAGIGLNVNQNTFDSSLPNPVSMRQAAGKHLDRADVLERFCHAFSIRYGQLESGNTGIIEQDYLDALYLRDIPHLFTLADSTRLEGTIRGIGGGGELMIETTEGEIRSFLFKEVSF